MHPLFLLFGGKGMNQIKSRFADVKPYYTQQNACRIVDPKQYRLYMKHGLYPIDMYYSGDIIVMVFDRKESYPLYKKWCDRTLE